MKLNQIDNNRAVHGSYQFKQIVFMKKRNHLHSRGLVLLVLLFIGAVAKAQVMINPMPIAGFQIASKDILNFNVVYNHAEPVKVQFEANLTDERGALVVQYISGTQTLKSGVNQFNPNSYNITQTRYVNTSIANIERMTSFLPQGDYSYCISMKCVDAPEVCERTIKLEVDYSACNDVHSEPVTPLLLSFPEDEAKLKNKRPTFTWIPPMPIGNNPNLTYTYSLVKMLDGQTAEDAIRRNRALFTQSGLRSISIMFPNQLNDLVEGEHYAWQVSAELGDLHIATSDVWEFEIEEEEEVTAAFITKRKIGLEAYTHPREQPFLLVLNERYIQDNEWKVRLKDETTNQWQDLSYLHLKKALGKKNIEINPADIQDMQAGHSYVFELSDHKGDKFFVRIIFTETEEK